MITVSREEAKKITPKNPRFEDLRNLRRIARKARSNNRIRIDGIDQLLINMQIQKINRRQETEIPEITEMWSEEWIQVCKNWHKAIERKIAEEAHIETQKNIIERVERRFGMIKGEEKKMLNSILTRPWKKVCIDKIITQDLERGKTKNLITDLEEVKVETDKFFANQFRKRKHHFENMSEEWRKEYGPKREIQTEWYGEVIKNIKEEK